MSDLELVDLEAGEGRGRTATLAPPSSASKRQDTNGNASNEKSASNKDPLTICEEARYEYTCHEKSKAESTNLQKIKQAIAAFFGRARKARLTPPMYRYHEDIAVKELEGKLFKILANECMEQRYDDNVDARFGFVNFLSFGRLHHMNLHYFEVELACELADIVKKKDTDRDQLLRIRTKLRGYSAAIEDYKRVLKHWQQPFRGELTAYHKHILPQDFRDLIKDNHRCSWDNAYIPLRSNNPWAANLFGRVMAAIFGGVALIAPVLVMTVPDAPVKQLVTTSIAVVIAAIGLALVSQGSWRDILGITAAYAAVLVVFVGTGTSRLTSRVGEQLGEHG
ncbi:uncharacterized protein EI97DRAFT_446390 [Westerdykella ornata]|uniref:DUF6594 domain-containing protein n=1 Tax=Westerdykella ornata TaxID=318751 RepID=A0A6A6J5Q1_WESOR|nr:uncharacterized protein EI97DRAFT_446390 [Westerdykella ornata]KAF2271722.1 hypothetical protein EI97DRAFT_446390 [Westerdykella ornata]